MAIPRPFVVSLLVASLVASACDGGGNAAAARTAPSVANLELTPRVAYQDPAPIQFAAGFDLFDPNRDVTGITFLLRDATGNVFAQQSLAYTATTASARVQGVAMVALPQVGTFTVEIWATDASGLASNALATTVDVVPHPWSAVAPDPILRQAMAAVALGDQIYVIGGRRMDLGVVPGPSTPIVGRLDASTGTWTNAPELSLPRHALAAAVANGRIYAIGGGSSTASGGPLTMIEELDPAATAWTPRAPLPTARMALAAATLGGRIYAVGGYTSSESEPLATVESYDPVADTWRSEPSLLHPRSRAAAAVIGDRLVVAGGLRATQQCENRVEVFDPATGTWSTTPDANLCADWLAIAGDRLFAGNGRDLLSTAGAEPIQWRGLTERRGDPDPRHAAAAANGAIFLFREWGVDRYVLAHELR